MPPHRTRLQRPPRCVLVVDGSRASHGTPPHRARLRRHPYCVLDGAFPRSVLVVDSGRASQRTPHPRAHLLALVGGGSALRDACSAAVASSDMCLTAGTSPAAPCPRQMHARAAASSPLMLARRQPPDACSGDGLHLLCLSGAVLLKLPSAAFSWWSRGGRERKKLCG